MKTKQAIIPFENDNLKGYSLLLRIEVALRELLKLSLQSQFGPQWRKRLPGDLLKKIKESQQEENQPQFGHVRLGPLYYLTFGELLTLLQQKAGRPVAEKLGGNCVLKQLENIFVSRNAICHSRPVSLVGLKTIETLYTEIETALSADVLACLVKNPDVGLAQCQAADKMIAALKAALTDLPTLPASIAIPEAFTIAIAQFWWADDALAGFKRSLVESAFECIKQYNALPKGVGCAGKRQQYCEEHRMTQIVENAITELDKITL